MPHAPSSYFQDRIISLCIISAPPFTNGNLVKAKSLIYVHFSETTCTKTRKMLYCWRFLFFSPKTQARVNFGEPRRKRLGSSVPQVPLSLLTTSATSSMPFLEVANSLLGRMERRTVRRGWLGSGASTSPMAEERRSSGSNSAGPKNK